MTAKERKEDVAALVAASCSTKTVQTSHLNQWVKWISAHTANPFVFDWSLTSLAGAAVEHRVDTAGVFLGCGVLLGFGGGGGGLGGHDAALFLFDVDGGHKFDSFQCSVFREEEEGDYWQASQVPPFSIASIEQAFFSAAVYCLASAAVAAV